MNVQFNKVAAALLCVGVMLVLGGLLVVIPANSFPSEDAAILYTYSENLADTGIVSYYRGGPPVEGATDFLWMAILALLYKVGSPTYLAATVLSAVALVGSALALRRLAGQRSLVAASLYLLYLLALPQIFAAVQGFSPPLFGLAIVMLLVFFREKKSAALFVTGLLACLIRPDGVVFAAPLAAAHLWFDREHVRRNLGLAGLLAVLPGLIYFLWRWRYFGHLLPLPFYVKSNIVRYLGVFERDSLFTNLRFLGATLPLLAVAFAALRKLDGVEARRLGLGMALLVVCPLLFYSCMRLEQNLAYRFQYPFVLLPVAFVAATRAWGSMRRGWVVAAHVAVPVLLAPFFAVEGLRTLSMPTENVPYIARDLARLECRGRMAVSEAGRLPYYSGWECVDLWGLNTPELARTLVTPDYVRAFAPDLIVLNANGDDGPNNYAFVRNPTTGPHVERSWMNMVENAFAAAGADRYDMFMVPHLYRPNCTGWIGAFSDFKDGLVQSVGYRRKFGVHYLYLLRRDSPCVEAMRDVLIRRGAMDFDMFLERKRAYESGVGSG